MCVGAIQGGGERGWYEGVGRADFCQPGGRQELGPATRAFRGAACMWLEEQAAGCQEEGMTGDYVVRLVKRGLVEKGEGGRGRAGFWLPEVAVKSKLMAARRKVGPGTW